MNLGSFKRFFCGIRAGRLTVLLILLFAFIPLYLSASESKTEKLLKAKSEIESSAISMNRQYQEITGKINKLKSKKSLSILEEAELLSLMAQAQSISVQLERKYGELEKVIEELKNAGLEIPKEKPEVLTLRISGANHFEGPSELREKVLILKDKENKLLREIERLEAAEKKMRLKEESQAFIREQSLFDEDSVMAVVKKNVKGVSESASQVQSGGKDEKSVTETGFDSSVGTSTTVPSSGSSSQDIKIRIEVTYEKSGLVSQMNIGKEKPLLIDIDLNNTGSDELKEKIELLKRVYEELSLKRSDVEKRAAELEKLFKEKKK